MNVFDIYGNVFAGVADFAIKTCKEQSKAAFIVRAEVGIDDLKVYEIVWKGEDEGSVVKNANNCRDLLIYARNRRSNG